MMTDIDKRVTRQMKWLSAAVAILILLLCANFYLALVKPNETTQTIVGPIGPRGAFGERGEKGEPGDKGDTGWPGPRGESGQNGTNGANGLNGSDGKNGLNGADGVNGTNGINGRTPEMGCINGNVSWKYADEATWRPLYQTVCPVTDEAIGE